MDAQLTKSLRLRKMKKDDLPELAAWAAEAFAHEDTGLGWTKESMLGHLDDDFRDQHSFVVYDKNRLVGGIIAYPCKYDRGKELFLHTIVIRKDKRFQGVGKTFLKWFIQYAKNQGMTGVRLDAHVSLPSYKWYRQFGFEQSGWEQQLLKLAKPL